MPIIWRRKLILEELLSAGPDTIAMADGPTGLYPFQLAVEASFESGRMKKDHLEMAFELLRKKPDLCSIALEGKLHS